MSTGSEARVHASRYFPWFDWLRFTLASTVMLGHFGLLRNLPNSGNFAVQVFFALSGFLIGGILLKLRRDDLPRFYFNRAIRIWVPYYLALLFLVMASLLRHEPVTAKWLEFVAYKATFVYNLFGPPQLATSVRAMPLAGTGNHFWSVNAEEQFYLLAPVLLVLASPWFGRRLLVWIPLALVAWVTDVYAAIVFGVVAAMLLQRYPGFHLSRVARAVLVAVIAFSWFANLHTAHYRLIAPWCGIAVV
ncbi:MAG: acyltransferase, partial [Caldimonas sp.]